MNRTESQTSDITAQAAPPQPGNVSSGGLAQLLNKRNSARASGRAAAAVAPQGAGTAANGSAADSTPAASRQPAAQGGDRRRTDDENHSQDANEHEVGAAATAGASHESEPSTQESGEGAESQEAPEATKPSRADRRIKRLIGDIKRLEAENAELRGAGGRQRSPEPEAPGGPEVQEVSRDLAKHQRVHAWLLKNPDGGEIELEGRRINVTAEEAAELSASLPSKLASLTARREVLLGKSRAEFEARQAEFHAQAAEAYPWIEDQESEEFAEAIELIRALPEPVAQAFRSLPDSRLLLGDLIAGRRARAAKVAKPSARPAQRPTPQPAASTAAAPRVNGAGKGFSEARNRFSSSGRSSDLSSALAARRRATREVEA